MQGANYRIMPLLLLLLLFHEPSCSAWITIPAGRQPTTSYPFLDCSRGRLHLTACFAKKKNNNNSNKGFGKQEAKKNSNSNDDTPSAESTAKPIYSQPALYDLAFGYRDFAEEVDFLWASHVNVTGSAPTRTLEVAAGPARHSLAALQEYDDSLQAAYCLDNAVTMQEYALDVAQHELSVDEQAKLHYHVADMRHITSDLVTQSVDTAWILLGSLQHLTSNDDVRACLQGIHDVLTDNGTLILELPHPRETFRMVECTRNGWKVPLEDVGDGSDSGELAIVWGDDNDEFDEITQVRQFTVRMQLTGTGEEDVTLQEVVPMRLFTAQEMEALATAAGFRVASLHGALEEGVEVNDEDAAYRLVVVLQKV